MDIKNDLVRIISELGITCDGEGESDDLLDSLDSVLIAELIIHIEEKWNIEIRGEDIIPENFANIQAVASLVNKYL